MGKTRKIAGTAADASMPKTPIQIDGKSYDLCFDYGALSEAETRINMELAAAGTGERVNLLIALAELNLTSVPILFAAGLRTFHPEIEFVRARRMVRPDNLFLVAGVIQNAWKASTPEAKSNPPEAQPAK